MSDLLWQGLMISLIGIGLTFAALGLLVLVMMILERLTRETVSPTADLEEDRLIREVVQPDSEADTEEEIAVAIAVAVAHFQAADIGRSSLGATLLNGPGAWRTRSNHRKDRA